MEIAWGRGVSPEDKKHIQVCTACSKIENRIEELDRLFTEESSLEIPVGFADKVGRRIEDYIETSPVSHQSYFMKLAYSRMVQWALVGVGMVFGLIKIMKFFSGGMI